MKRPQILVLLLIGVATGLALPVSPVEKIPSGADTSPAKRERKGSIRVPDDVRQRIGSIRSAKGRGARMQEVIRLAASLPVADLERWYRGNYLEFLDGEIEGLFYMIADQRWMEADPAGFARYKIDAKDSYPDAALAAWLQADEAAATAYLESLDPERRKALAIPLLRVIGKTDLPRALGMLDELKDSKGDQQYYLRDVFRNFAAADRDLVVSHIQNWKASDREWAVTSIVVAGLKQDFAWTLGFLQAEGKGPETITDAMNQGGGWGMGAKMLLANAASMPEGWIDKMAETTIISNGCGDEWLTMRPPVKGIPDEVLAKIQLNAASGGFWDNDKLETGKQLVTDGDWLPLETRAKLVASIVRTWRDGPEAEAEWLASLDDELKGEFEKAPDHAAVSASKKIIPNHDRNPSQLIRTLGESGNSAGFGRSALNWDQTQIGEAISTVANLGPDAALKAFGEGDAAVPPAVRAALAARSLPAMQPEEVTGNFLRIASDWAATDPAGAAKWVETLPPGEAREWAAKNVVLRWSSYSPSEAKAWESRFSASGK